AWMLDVLFDPARARQYPVFLVESAEAMDAIGLHHDDRRQRFSYETLVPVRESLQRLASEYGRLPAAEQTPAQKQVQRLATNLLLYDALANSLAFARGQLDRLEVAGAVLRIIPPVDGAIDATWLSPAQVVTEALKRQGAHVDQGQLIRTLRQLQTKAGEPAAFSKGLGAFREQVAALAGPAALAHLPLELHLHRLAPFSLALTLYVLATLLIAAGWLAPRQRWLYRVSLVCVTIPLFLHLYGIILRCIIRGRPPVSTLYETILFVTAVAVVIAVVIEVIYRHRLAAGLAGFLGALGLFLAGRYEAIDGQDTMPALMAVLDTNFWLATHVTTVTIGYAAGLLASALAHVYLLGRATGLGASRQEGFKQLTGMVYGTVCFCLLFSTVGTILGGIWATESWGRFWGWDPKENGALMIVLWGLTILHARAGGYIRELGVHLAAIFLGVIVAFSWFGVNLLGVGLHSYGFTAGVHTALQAFYLVESLVLLSGLIAWYRLDTDLR
ncbi:MAG: cytochrome c biogenesis protein CcsA, partial [Candidatus Hydrogenedentes bacterium]|nr:cytochrome c biogenesis protein CcsA [Candidatus Hydrogenedentota bacterium]